MWEVENSQAVRNELDLSTLPDVVPSETRTFKCDFIMAEPSFGGVGQGVAKPSLLLVLGPESKASPSDSTVVHSDFTPAPPPFDVDWGFDRKGDWDLGSIGLERT